MISEQLQFKIIIMSEDSETKSLRHPEIMENRVFGGVLLCWQIGACFYYGYRETYAAENTTQNNHFLVAMLSLLVVGFGLINVYIKRASAASLVHMFLIVAITFQLYFLAVGIFEKARIPYWQNQTAWDDDKYVPIGLTNVHTDRSNSPTIKQASYVNCLACCISLIVGYSAMVGRISNLQTLLFASVGVFAFQINNQILWRYSTNDFGFSMRVFGFGSCYGLIASIFLGKFKQTKDHKDYSSDYLFQLFAFIGAIIAWALLPALSMASLFHHNSHADYKYMNGAIMRIWLALMSSVVGSFCGSLIMHKKFSIHDITFSLLAGGIIYGSTIQKPYTFSLPVSLAFVISFLAAIGARKLKTIMNSRGIIDSNGIFSHYFIPSLFAGVVSLQMRGIGISYGCGLCAGIIVGLFFMFLRFRTQNEQFTSKMCVGVDEDPKTN